MSTNKRGPLVKVWYVRPELDPEPHPYQHVLIESGPSGVMLEGIYEEDNRRTFVPWCKVFYIESEVSA